MNSAVIVVTIIGLEILVRSGNCPSRPLTMEKAISLLVCPDQAMMERSTTHYMSVEQNIERVYNKRRAITVSALPVVDVRRGANFRPDSFNYLLLINITREC